MTNGIGNAVGVRHTETSLIVWSAVSGGDQAGASNALEGAGEAEPPAPLYNADRYYDAGDKGCAFGPMDEIADLMNQMEPGSTLEVHATDPSVASDLGAWCRMTGNEMVDQQDGHYLVMRK